MGRVVVIVLILVALLLTAGIMLPAVYRARNEEEFRRCQNHLRQVGNVGLFHSVTPGDPVPTRALEYLPAGTLGPERFAPEQRLSWYPLIMSAIEVNPAVAPEQRRSDTPMLGLLRGLDVQQAWDAPANQKMAKTKLVVALCPAQRPTPTMDGFERTNYLGNGGLGANTPALSIEEAGGKAGVFRYDIRTPIEAIRDGDGLSNTISIVETARDLGPWLSGGPATIRCLEGDDPPLGPGRMYAGCHPNRANFAFADGSVQVKSIQMDPVVFRAMLTIQGGDSEADFSDRQP